MPTLQIFTNVDQSKLTAALATKATDVVAKALGKPKSYVCVALIPSVMTFAGDASPTAQIHLSSIGEIDPQTNKSTTVAITNLLSKELGIDSSRFYIFFHDLEKANVGYMGQTFADLM